MKFSSALVALSLVLTPFTSAVPLRDSILEERQSNIVVTTGATNGVLPRFEIRQLQATKPNQWILLILAFQKWQQQTQDPPYTTTYFGIAKIHGAPTGDYNNVGRCSNCNGWGYCTHINVLFPSWHRAYLALFEQELLKVAQSLVSTFPESRRAVMQNAANHLRLPYYDWAAAPPNNGPVFPTFFSDATISVDGPSGPQTINNPFFQITIKNPERMPYLAFNTYKTTLRNPTTGDASARSQNQVTAYAMQVNRPGRKSSIYQLLTGCHDYQSMATSVGGNNGGCLDHLESIHDDIHNDIGGMGDSSKGNYGGHMSVLPEASFDPVFWFHHAMVDRIFALWQTVNPNAYGATMTTLSNGTTWTIPSGSVQGPDSPLTPFYKDNGRNFWTTNQVRDWARTFQYTYPEYTDSDGSQGAILGYINRLYSPSGNAVAGSSKRDLPAPSPQGTGSLPAPFYQWNANIKTTHHALDGNYIVFVFVGQPQTSDPHSWISDPAYIGRSSFLAAPREPMAIHISNSTHLVTSSVPLNHGLQRLINSGVLPADLSPEVVTPYLTKNLVWRVAGPKAEDVPIDQVKGLMVAASSTLLQLPSQGEADAKAPKWSNFTIVPQITKMKLGGLNKTAAWNATTVGQVLGNSTISKVVTGLLGNETVGDLVTGVLGHLPV